MSAQLGLDFRRLARGLTATNQAVTKQITSISKIHNLVRERAHILKKEST